MGIDADTLKGFIDLPPEKAARILPGFTENINKLIECDARKAELLKQMIFHVTIKAHGLDSKDIAQYIFEHIRKVRTPCCTDVDPRGYTMVEKDAVDWKSGQPEDRYTTMIRKTNRIVGVIVKKTDENSPQRVVRFAVPVEHWKTIP